MGILNKIINKKSKFISRDEIIQMLKTSPEKLEEFEQFYQNEVLPNMQSDFDNPFDMNAKQASEHAKQVTPKIYDKMVNHIIENRTNDMINRIVNELLAKTTTWCYDGETTFVSDSHVLPDNITPVTLDEIKTIPKELKPQLTGNLIQADMPNQSAPALLFYLKKMQETTKPKLKQELYHHFRQGLDILDLDPLTYEMIGTNQNSMGHWLPQLVAANETKGFFKIPKTIIAKVPLPILQLTRNDFGSLTPTTKTIVNQWAINAFDLDFDKDYFVKTGTYSSKFDFRNCRINDPKEVAEIGEYLLYIHFAALQMASPLNKPCIYGVSTTNEWVVREYIPDNEYNPVIYKGLPLRTEYRVFIDCDTNEILGVNPYWEPETMKKRFDEHRDGHDEHDAIVYRAYESTLMSRYHTNVYTVTSHVQELLPDLHLTGQWSLDIMQNGDEFWLIDMALAQNSAGYNEIVKHTKQRPTTENWIPVLE